MSEEKERRCKSCGKRLIDEKLPFCRRCALEGRNKAVQFGGMIGGAATFILSALTFANNNSNNAHNQE